MAASRYCLVTADARNYILATGRQWDLIISEPSNPWVSGISNLFTTDFFRLIKQKLAPGGIMTQWFHLYGVSVDDVKTIHRETGYELGVVDIRELAWNENGGQVASNWPCSGPAHHRTAPLIGSW